VFTVDRKPGAWGDSLKQVVAAIRTDTLKKHSTELSTVAMEADMLVAVPWSTQNMRRQDSLSGFGGDEDDSATRGRYRAPTVGHKDRKGEYRAPDTSAASYETVEIGRAAEYAAASGSNIDMDNYQPVEAGGNQSWAPNPLYTGGGNPLDHPDNNNPLYASGGQGDTSFYDSQPGPDNSLYDEATGTGGDIDL